ncbi:hypothetical protein GCM10025734_60830 [Kitasatospora paranensis]
MFGLPALAGPAAYLAARRAAGGAGATRRLLAAAGLAHLLVDTGLTGAAGRPLLPPVELAALAGAEVHTVVRLEHVAGVSPPSRTPGRRRSTRRWRPPAPERWRSSPCWPTGPGWPSRPARRAAPRSSAPPGTPVPEGRAPTG